MEGEGMSWMFRKVSVYSNLSKAIKLDSNIEIALCPLKWDIGEDERLGKMGPLA